jgi:hypothetical protein
MGMEQATASSTLPVSSTGRDADLALAGLIGMLDRADGAVVRRGPRPRRSMAYREMAYREIAYRAVGARPVSDRWDPMRTVGSRVPLPPLTAVPYPASVTPPRPAEIRQRRPAGSGGRLRMLLRGLVRRAALWGAGPDGASLAWGGPPPRPAYRAGARPVDPPVVLREMPSTPTIRPAASSPSAALRAADPLAGRRRRPQVPPVAPESRHLLGRIAASSPVPLSGAIGLPESRARAPAGIRGSPGRPLARGSPSGRPDPG